MRVHRFEGFPESGLGSALAPGAGCVKYLALAVVLIQVFLAASGFGAEPFFCTLRSTLCANVVQLFHLRPRRAIRARALGSYGLHHGRGDNYTNGY